MLEASRTYNSKTSYSCMCGLFSFKQKNLCLDIKLGLTRINWFTYARKINSEHVYYWAPSSHTLIIASRSVIMKSNTRDMSLFCPNTSSKLSTFSCCSSCINLISLEYDSSLLSKITSKHGRTTHETVLSKYVLLTGAHTIPALPTDPNDYQ